MPDKKFPGAVNTCEVTFRYPSGAPLKIRVHGRRSQVDGQIRAAVGQRKKKMSFWDLNTAKNVVVDLERFDTWSVN